MSAPTPPRDDDRNAASSLDRRTVLRNASMLFAGAAFVQAMGGVRAQETGPAEANAPGDDDRLTVAPSEPGATAGAAPLIEGFTPFDIETSGGVTIHAVKGGSGPPLLLLHGAPMTHYTWREIAPRLAQEYTVVAADLRGYGDSSKPEGLPDHSNYSKRTMAQDQIDVMRHFGFERFALVGQDRGGRVGHRMVLDHPDAVTKAVFIDIVPTYYLYTHVTLDFVQAYYHWFSYLRPAPVPENELLAANAARAAAGRQLPPAMLAYQRANGTPEGVHGMCEDYRAGASIDLVHDGADIDQRIRCPLDVLWAEGGSMDRLYDVLAIWRERGTDVVGKPMPGGHNMQEGAPEEVLAELQRFLQA